MLITFTGAQSTGKTTLLNELKKRLTDFTFIDEITRSIQRRGFKINEAGTDETQLEIMKQHKANSDLSNAILDRCALDGLVYTTWLYHQGSVSQETYEEVELIYQSTIDKYDVIFYTEPDIELVDDGVRSINKDFRDDIIFIFEEIIARDNLNVIRLKGSVEERLKTIRETLREIEKC